MKSKFAILAIVLLSLSLTGCQAPKIKSIRDEPSITAVTVVTSTDTITIENNGFIPPLAGVTIGEQVRFINLDEAIHQVAADPHPQHNILPDLFSSEIHKGETWNYIFKSAGTFGIHLEDNPSVQSKIVVSASKK